MEAELSKWKKKDIKMEDTAYARSLTVKRMEFNAAANTFTRYQRDEMRAQFDKMDGADEPVPPLPPLPEVPEVVGGADTCAGDGEQAAM